MSVFKKRVDGFCDEFELPSKTRYLLYSHYPLFYAAWNSRFGKSPWSNLSQGFLNLAQLYELKLRIPTQLNRQQTVNISFEPNNLNSFQEIFFGGEYKSPWDLSDCFSLVDVGANIGLASQYFLTQAPLKVIIMVEANPTLVETINQRLKSQNLDCKFIVSPSCVSGVTGESVSFSISSNNRDSAITAPNQSPKSLDVHTIALSDLLDQYDLPQIDILKMDIEGAEHSVIDFDLAGLQRCRFLFFEVHGSSSVRRSFESKLQSSGFETTIISEAEPHQCEILAAKNKAM